MLGTFSIIVLQPQISSQGNNPFLLSVEGEFVTKNLVLVAVRLSLGGQLLQREPEREKKTKETKNSETPTEAHQLRKAVNEGLRIGLPATVPHQWPPCSRFLQR